MVKNKYLQFSKMLENVSILLSKHMRSKLFAKIVKMKYKNSFSTKISMGYQKGRIVC
jgi:hypothetical protein